jgi:signal transduction histidine kinase
MENAALYRRLKQETMARMQLIMEAKLASLGAMVAGIAHELRNPLNFMTNFAELSVDLAAEAEEGLRAQQSRLPAEAHEELAETLASLRENTGRIREHGRRAGAIIQGMLQHARSSPGTREAGDLNAVLAESVCLGCEGSAAAEIGVQVVAEYDPAVAPVQMAGLEMGRVFLNVVENALYAMREKKHAQGAAYVPELRVCTAERGDHVEVRLRDNGTGIPASVVQRIFEPFFTTKPSGQGTGLGLSLSYEIVVQGHHGTMRVETAAGEWTEIVITVPRSPPSGRARSSSPGSLAPTQADES